MLNTSTNKVIITRDVVFLRTNYAEWIKGKNSKPKDLNSILTNADSDDRHVDPIQQSNLVNDDETSE